MRTKVLACIAGIALTFQINPASTTALAQPHTLKPAAFVKPVRFSNVSFTYESSIASQIVGYNDKKTQVAVCDANGTKTVHFAFKKYTVTRTFLIPANVTVIPVAALNKDSCVSRWAGPQLARMTTILKTRPYLSTLQSLPMVPVPNTIPMFYLRTRYLRFANGSGLSFISAYAQGPARVTNALPVFYSFQGLTDDRRFWVSVYLPLHVAMLPAAGSVVTNNYQAYLQGVIKQLKGVPDAGYRPNPRSLDALVRSIRANPTGL